MSDRELLENAAKAAGIELKGWTTISGEEEAVIGFDAYTVETWNPLTDDGDALRLAVKLEMDIQVFGGCTFGKGNKVVSVQIEDHDVVSERHGDDPYAATRRAIVRAAANLGEKS